MLALSLSDKFCYFGIFVFVFDFFVFNRLLFFRFSFVFVFIIFSFLFSFSLTNSLFSRFSTFSFSFSLTKITLVLSNLFYNIHVTFVFASDLRDDQLCYLFITAHCAY